MQVGLKRDSSFLLLYCDETSLRKYSPLIHSRFIMSSLKDHNHFVLMTETCKLVNKIRNIAESHDQTASSQVVFPKDLRMQGTSFTLAGKNKQLKKKCTK